MKKRLAGMLFGAFLVGLFLAFSRDGVNWNFSGHSSATLSYFSYFGSRFHFPGTPLPVLAADGGGYGYRSLAILLPLWTTMRNIAYMVFALVFIVVGFMIIFRFKIDQKTVLGIENALPKMIKALILVTFSYAIAGFLIDLMWLLTQLVTNIASSWMSAGIIHTPWGRDIVMTTKFESLDDLWGYAMAVTGAGAIAIVRVFSNLPSLWELIDAAQKTTFSNPFELIDFITKVGKFIVDLVTGFYFRGSISVVLGVVGIIVLFFATLWAVFKTWLSLLSAYVQIILNVIFSPLYLMMEALPGQNSFGTWLKQLITNLLVFPFVTVLLYLSAYFIKSAFVPDLTGSGFAVPLMGTDTGALIILVGVWLFLTIPKALDILKEVIKTIELKNANAWMENVKTGYNNPVTQGAYGMAYQRTGAAWQAWEQQRLKTLVDPNAAGQVQVPQNAGPQILQHMPQRLPGSR